MLIMSLSLSDDPVYVKNLAKLMEISDRQTSSFIIDIWELPFVKLRISTNLFDNIGMTHWIYGNSNEVIITFCSKQLGCHYAIMDMGLNRNGSDWKLIKEPQEIMFYSDNEGTRKNVLFGEDPRLFLANNRLFLILVFHVQPFNRQGFGELFYNRMTKTLYLLESKFSVIHIVHEAGVGHQKNWSPFAYKDRNHVLNSTSLLGSDEEHVLFSYQPDPHRIMESENFTSTAKGERFHTIFATRVVNTNIQQLWPYGASIRGGTPAVLVNTKYGPKYLAFFHSSGKILVSYILTYFMGAYLFDPEPPFKVTHFSREPVVAKPFYDEHIDGWTYKALDYVIFPMGLIVSNGTLVVSLGHNDKSSWIMLMNFTNFIDSLASVQSDMVDIPSLFARGYNGK
jgi:hypothetical protein